MHSPAKLSWTFTPGAQDRLGPLCVSTPQTWALQCLRALPRRAAFRSDPQGRAPLFVKSFRPSSWFDRWRLGTQAAAEWSILRRLHDEGLAVPPPLAFARQEGGTLWIFQEWIEGMAWDRPHASRDSRNLRQLGALLRDLHDRGLRDPDRHAGNFLLGSEGKSWAVDFHKARLGAPLDASERRQALALLDASLTGALSPRERARVLREYLRGTNLEFGPLAREIASESFLLRGRNLARKSGKAFHEGRRFQSLRCGSHRGFARRDGPTEAIERAYRAWKAGELHTIKRGRRNEVAQTKDAFPLIIKSYRHRSVFSSMRTILGLGRARRAWQRAFHLELCGARGAQVLACLEGPGADLLVSQKVSASIPLPQAVAMHGQDRTILRDLARSTADLVARLHRAGLRARDLRGENLLASEGKDGWIVTLVDFDGLRPCLEPERQLRDLGRLAASFPRIPRRAPLLFLRSYWRGIAGLGRRPSLRRISSQAEEAARKVRLRWKGKGQP